MKRDLLLRLYPRAWRERYGEELSAHLKAQRPLRIGVVADLVRGALDAHLHPLHRDNSTMRIPNLSDRRTIAARATVVWGPVGAVAIAYAMVLIDFWYGNQTWFYFVGTPPEGIAVDWFRPEGSGWVRFFPADQLYDLAMHLAILAVALAGALLFAALARKTLRESEPRAS